MKAKEFDINNVPPLVLYVWGMSYDSIPVGTEAFEKAITEHPEYFKEEVEYRKRWDSVPEEIKEAYFNETSGLDYVKEIIDEIGEPPYPEYSRMGIIWWAQNVDKYPKEISANDKWNDIYYKKLEVHNNKIYNKYFNEYGLSK